MPRTIYTISCDDAISFLCEATWGFAEVDPTGHFVWVNQAYCDILNAPVDLVLGTTYQQWTHPEDLQVDEELAAQVRAGTLPSYSLAKRYIQRGSTPQRPLITWGMLRVQGKFTQTGEFSGYRVQFSPYDHRREPSKNYLEEVKKLLIWMTNNWKTIVAVLVVLSTLIFGSSENLLELLQELRGMTSTVDTLLDSSSSGPSPVQP